MQLNSWYFKDYLRACLQNAPVLTRFCFPSRQQPNCSTVPNYTCESRGPKFKETGLRGCVSHYLEPVEHPPGPWSWKRQNLRKRSRLLVGSKRTCVIAESSLPGRTSSQAVCRLWPAGLSARHTYSPASSRVTLCRFSTYTLEALLCRGCTRELRLENLDSHVGRRERGLGAFAGSYGQFPRARRSFAGLPGLARLPPQPLDPGGQRPVDLAHQLGLAPQHGCGVFWETRHHQGLERPKI